MFSFEFDHDEADTLRRQDRHQARQQRALASAPDCRDPDHPGCEFCEEGEAE